MYHNKHLISEGKVKHVFEDGRGGDFLVIDKLNLNKSNLVMSKDLSLPEPMPDLRDSLLLSQLSSIFNRRTQPDEVTREPERPNKRARTSNS